MNDLRHKFTVQIILEYCITCQMATG